MLGLLLCAILSEWFQPGIITQAHESLLAKTERTYKESPNTFLGQFLISLLRIGTISMALCLCVYQGAGFSFIAFGAVCGLTVAVMLVKMLFNVAIDYAFSLPPLWRSIRDIRKYYHVGCDCALSHCTGAAAHRKPFDRTMGNRHCGTRFYRHVALSQRTDLRCILPRGGVSAALYMYLGSIADGNPLCFIC